MIAELSQDYPVRALCVVLGVSRSGYYRWRQGAETRRQVANRRLVEEIRRVHRQKRGRYGSPRVTHQLRREGHRCNHKRVERLMRQHGLRGCSSRRRRVCTTHSDHAEPVAPNRLLGRPAPTRPNEVWVADITYVPTAEGWLFVAAVMDLYSRQILGWSVWDSLHAGGALQALRRALVSRRYPQGVIHHSDRGIQYACAAYRQELQAHGLLASMSRKGNCYDNAMAESFFATLKTECFGHKPVASKAQAKLMLFDYIEAFYNTRRFHSALGYQSPVEFENQFS